jgi:hypothetical protein
MWSRWLTWSRRLPTRMTMGRTTVRMTVRRRV